jgi:transcriptional regulator with XRE-family HTH domain
MVTSKASKVTPASSGKPKNVAEYIAWQINLCGKKQTEIAEEIGFDKPNVITMIKQGKTKVPISKIGRFAKALEVDPIFFMKLVFSEYMPDVMEAINSIITQPIITQNEWEIIEVVRSAKVVNPKLRTDEERRALKDFINTLKPDNATR